MNPPGIAPLAVAEGVLFLACLEKGLTVKDLRTRCRKPELAFTRQAVMYAIRTRVGSDISYPQIAALVGISDHSTVKHGIRAAAERMEKDWAYKFFVNLLLEAEPMVPGEAAAEIIRLCQTRAELSAANLADARSKRAAAAAERLRMRRALKPRTSELEPCVDELGRVISLDKKGRCLPQIKDEFAIIAGSRGLALSILTARAQA